MTNMSYCRFQNTLKDFRDCMEWMLDHEDEVWKWKDSGGRIGGDSEYFENDDTNKLSDAEGIAMLKLIDAVDDFHRDFCDD